jgi:uncharacterized membrane protein (DUF4010 family)
MDVHDLISRFAVALGIGLLIGLERGWRTRELEPGSRAAGIRTFAITGLLGGTTGALAMALGGAASAGGGIVVAIGFASYAAVFGIFTLEENRAGGHYSATSAVAGMLTFALSAYALVGDMLIAAAAAVAAAGLLALRQQLHGWVASITWPELRSGLVLLTMTFIALPIMPNTPIGPFGGVNLREVWLIAIVLAGVSFAGYVSVKYFGVRYGLLLAAAAGGLASSTAVTIANARHAARGEGAPRLLAAGVAVASTIMFIRVLAIVAALRPSLLVLVAPALLSAAVVAVAFAVTWVTWQRNGDQEHREVAFRNPFGFWSVVGFALLLAAVIVLGRAVGEWLGAAGAITGAIVVGLADVDAVTVSMTRLVPDTLSAHQAALAILGAVASDTVSKVAIGAAIGRGWFATDIAAMASGCIAIGAAALWLTFMLVAA